MEPLDTMYIDGRFEAVRGREILTLVDPVEGTTPGRIALMRTPSGPSSTASDLVRPTTAHLLEAYGVRKAYPRRPATELIDTMQGLARESFSRGTARRAK